MSKFDFNAITLQSPADISRVGENFEKIEANAVTEEVFDTALEGKADLGPDGKVPASQLPPAETIQDATLTQKGIVQLANSVTSTSTSAAAVPASVKEAYDKGVEAKSAADAAQATANAAGSAASAAQGTANAAASAAANANANANAKEPALPLGTAAQYLRGDKVLASFADAVSAVAPVPKFIHNCTGVNDDLAVQNIVNNFFTSGTAMTMKLTITGTMGLQASPANNRHIDISAANARGAVCYLDFSDCHIPEITTASRDFFCVSSSTVKLVVDGIVVKTTKSGILIIGTAAIYPTGNMFINCNVTSSAKCINLVLARGNSFINCGCNGLGSNNGLDIDRSHDNMFINCTLVGSYNRAVAFSQAGNNYFSNCSIAGTSTNGVNAGAGGTRNNIFSNCLIKGTIGVVMGTASESIILISCVIVGSNIGIQVATSSTTANIRLIACAIQGTSTQDIEQTSAVSTAKWHIMGCSFSRAGIIVDGTTAITQKTSASIYMPQYANQFSQTIA